MAGKPQDPRTTPEPAPIESCKWIALTQGKFALVDAEDFEWLNQFSWVYAKGYARSGIYNPEIQKTRLHSMHRMITKPSGTSSRGYADVIVDHINGNTLDNRKANLRFTNVSGNLQNQRKRTKQTTSSFKGVSWNKEKQKWQVKIKANGKHIWLGYFDLEKEAARTYNEAAIRLFGEFANLNIIKENTEK